MTFHLGLRARSFGGSQAMGRSIPASIRALWVSSEGLSWSKQDSVIAYAAVERVTKSGFSVNGLATSSGGSRKARRWYDGFGLMRIANKSVVPTLPNPRQCHMIIDCKPVLGKMSLQEISAYLEAKHPSNLGRSAIRKNLEDLGLASLEDLIRCIHSSTSDHLETWKKHYWSWAQHHLDLQRSKQNGSVYGSTGPHVLEKLRLSARESPIGSVYSLISSNLVAMFKDEVTPMELFHPGMNILEVGGGTGLGTQIFLRSPSGAGSGSLRCARYDFTDISPAFLPTIQEELKDNASQLRFSTLDLIQDFVKQAFEAASYDVVVGVDVLHLPSDLTMSPTDVRKALRPGGKLIMHEMFEPFGWTLGFVFGLFPGWWVGVDGEQHRTPGPSLTMEQWDLLLKGAGFNGIDLRLRDPDSLLTDNKSG
ncbi:hypothetical protein DL765_001463 [Monosporascus sp. GIB2]|nr:hypothetical protein DL765_001463 [Monosporascus sp. GIB2]